MVYLETLLGELVTAGKIDRIETKLTNTEWKKTDRVITIRPGDDEMLLAGIPASDMELTASILIRCYGNQTAAEGVALSLETILAEVRDKIVEGILSGTGFSGLDPPVQIESCSLVDDPAFSAERDLSAATLELRIKNHGS